jgi:hypothetical protein
MYEGMNSYEPLHFTGPIMAVWMRLQPAIGTCYANLIVTVASKPFPSMTFLKPIYVSKHLN